MAQTQLTYVVVQAGDTLASVAERYKTTAATLARLNALDKEAPLTQGMFLNVPKPPPQPAKMNGTPRPRRPRCAFAVTTGQEGVYPGSQKALVREGQEGLTGIFPLWFQASSTEPWRLQSFADDRQITEMVQAAHERGVKVLPTISNLYYRGVVSGKEVAHQAMALHRQDLLESIRKVCARYGFDGILLDWTDLYEEDRRLATDWVWGLADLCRSEGWKLAVNVPFVQGKEGKPGIRLFELGEVGKACDLVCLLLNTEHGMYTSPGPLASIGWTEAGVNEALRLGLPAGKTLLGIGGYAYDWKANSQVPEYLSFEGAMNRARQYRVNVQFDEASQTPMYRYTDSSGAEHQVWFENTSSLLQKITLVNRLELAGISLWRLGIEDPNLWPLLRARWGSIKKWNNRYHNIDYDK